MKSPDSEYQNLEPYVKLGLLVPEIGQIVSSFVSTTGGSNVIIHELDQGHTNKLVASERN